MLCPNCNFEEIRVSIKGSRVLASPQTISRALEEVDSYLICPKCKKDSDDFMFFLNFNLKELNKRLQKAKSLRNQKLVQEIIDYSKDIHLLIKKIQSRKPRSQQPQRVIAHAAAAAASQKESVSKYLLLLLENMRKFKVIAGESAYESIDSPQFDRSKQEFLKLLRTSEHSLDLEKACIQLGDLIAKEEPQLLPKFSKFADWLRRENIVRLEKFKKINEHEFQRDMNTFLAIIDIKGHEFDFEEAYKEFGLLIINKVPQAEIPPLSRKLSRFIELLKIIRFRDLQFLLPESKRQFLLLIDIPRHNYKARQAAFEFKSFLQKETSEPERSKLLKKLEQFEAWLENPGEGFSWHL